MHIYIYAAAGSQRGANRRKLRSREVEAAVLGAGATPTGTYFQTPRCRLVKRPRSRGWFGYIYRTVLCLAAVRLFAQCSGSYRSRPSPAPYPGTGLRLLSVGDLIIGLAKPTSPHNGYPSGPLELELGPGV